eukprot:TRINITY_DN2934_c0_g1_i1.p1 TRINITY_DN2934_c0_g1~~TRINITY_DN2934_c0_g1_i1.p1  ORF type:complete len:344 (+),score=44.45 TRINITY_DN2934_c0_g1_i1:108-1034(+)
MKHAITGEVKDIIELVLRYRQLVPGASTTNESELAAFIAYSISFPSGFLALVDTYNTLKSGILNFEVVALALHELGYKAVGIRLDSGDLAYFSTIARSMFKDLSNQFNVPYFEQFKICASSDIDEDVLHSLSSQGHEIDIFGIGTNLVTCKGSPALGCVYKLVSINGQPRLKLSNNISKVTIPGRKEAYRLIGHQGPVLDLLIEVGAESPKVGESIYCRHPFDEKKRCIVKPSTVEKLHHLVWDGKIVEGALKSLDAIKDYCKSQIDSLRPDYKYHTNPTVYKISISSNLYEIFHQLWLKESPVEEII